MHWMLGQHRSTLKTCQRPTVTPPESAEPVPACAGSGGGAGGRDSRRVERASEGFAGLRQDPGRLGVCRGGHLCPALFHPGSAPRHGRRASGQRRRSRADHFTGHRGPRRHRHPLVVPRRPDRKGEGHDLGNLAWPPALGLLVPPATSFPVLLGLRMLEGMALGGIPAIAIAYLNEEIDRAHAAVAAGSYVAGTTLGGLAGRLVAGRRGNCGGGARPPSPSQSWPPWPPCSSWS